MASGGGVDPGKTYLIGENGPELFAPGMRGSIVPNHALASSVSNNYVIDARGADLGAHNRIARGIEASHNAAVAKSVQASVERARRTPK